MKHRYTKEQLLAAINCSSSIRQALISLDIAPLGGNYKIIHKAIVAYSIDISHFTQQGWAKNKKLGPKTTTDIYLQNKKQIGSFRLKNRLLSEGFFDHICSCCKQTQWLFETIPLELDHIDGDNENNNLQNLRLLCPNCHALTPTYRGKNQKRAKLGSG